MTESLRETIILIVQVCSLLALIMYVVKTAEMARETKKSAAATEKSIEEMVEDRNMEFAPYVVVYFDAQTDSPIFDLVITNTGKTIANNVKVEFTPPLQTSLKNYKLDELSMLHQVIPAIPPGFELRTSFDRLETRLGSSNLPRLYQVKVTFSGGLNDRLREINYLLDLNMFHGIWESHKSSLTDLTHAVEDIPRNLSVISDELKKVTIQLGKLNNGSEKETENNDEVLTRKVAENLETISRAIAGLDQTLKSKTNKIW